MVGMAIGQAMGMGTEQAMKFGGALGITGVAVNTWIKNWESVKAVMRDTQPFETVKSLLEEIGDLSQRGLHFAINLRGGTHNPAADDVQRRGLKDVEERKEHAEKMR